MASRSVTAAGAVALLGAGVLAGCGGGVDEPAGPTSACGEGVPAADVDLEGLTEQDVLSVSGSQVFEQVVVYRDGRVAVVGSSQADWQRAFESAASAEAHPDPDAARGVQLAALTSSDPASPAIAIVPAMAWMPHPASPRLLVGQLPECALTELDDLAARLGDVLRRTGGDLGDPQITDQSTSMLDYRGANAVEARAYALTAGHEQGLSGPQREGRALMRAMAGTITWNLPEVREVAPTAFERYESYGDCVPITDPDDVAAVLAAYDADGEIPENLEARAVPPGIEPCA